MRHHYVYSIARNSINSTLIKEPNKTENNEASIFYPPYAVSALLLLVAADAKQCDTGFGGTKNNEVQITWMSPAKKVAPCCVTICAHTLCCLIRRLDFAYGKTIIVDFIFYNFLF
jgi:hypothetical protein